jgi:hypothetical protein
MRAGRFPIRRRGLPPGQLQGGVGQIDLVIVELADGVQDCVSLAQASPSCFT